MHRNFKQWAAILLLLLFASGGYNIFLQAKSRKARCQLNKEKLKMDSVLSLKIQSDHALQVIRDSLRHNHPEHDLLIIKKGPVSTSSLR